MEPQEEARLGQRRLARDIPVGTAPTAFPSAVTQRAALRDGPWRDGASSGRTGISAAWVKYVAELMKPEYLAARCRQRSAAQLSLNELRERSKMAVNCFAMTLRPIPFFMEEAKPATWSVETRAR